MQDNIIKATKNLEISSEEIKILVKFFKTIFYKI